VGVVVPERRLDSALDAPFQTNSLKHLVAVIIARANPVHSRVGPR
jgi:hypothetical protein